MNSACGAFRQRLEQALADQERAPAWQLRSLSWHEHLLSCQACRALLAAEEALEILLASLPDPRLPPGVAERVLARLAREREAAALDALLERAAPVPAPPDLAHKVLAGLEAARAQAALDRLLERLPAPAAPAGLAARVLAGLERERGALPRATLAMVPRSVPRSPLALGLRLTAAAAVLAAGALGVRALLRHADRAARQGLAVAVSSPSAAATLEVPPAGLLESLELLESWDLIADDSLEVVLTSIDTVDEVLLEIDRGNDPLASSEE